MTALHNDLETDVPQLVPVGPTTALRHLAEIPRVVRELWWTLLGEVTLAAAVAGDMAVAISVIEIETATVTFEIIEMARHFAET